MSDKAQFVLIIFLLALLCAEFVVVHALIESALKAGNEALHILEQI